MTAARPLVTAPPQALVKQGVGASMAATAIGLNPYQRPIDAWLVLTGRAAPFAGNEATQWGQILEPVIRAHYVEKNQVAVYVPPTSLFHPELPWLRATPDGIVVENGTWQYVAPQVKSVGLRMAPRWEDGPPEEYVIQAVVEMAVTNLDRLDFAVLIGAQKYEQHIVHRDAELESLVLQQLRDFWRLVEIDQQPEVDGSDTFRRHLVGQIKKRQVIEATADELPKLERWREVAIDLKKLKSEEKHIKNELLAVLAAKNGNVLASSLGDIKVGNPRKKTGWKDVAEKLRPLHRVAHLLDREFVNLRFQLVDVPGGEPLIEKVDGLRAQLKLAAQLTNTFDDIVASCTKLGDPGVNRPRDWTAGVGDADEEETDNG